MLLSDTKNIHALTSQLGLTLNESEVYFYLLKNGLTPGADIYMQLDMDKSSCYRALNSLRNKNLAYKVGEERNQKFGASHPDFLFGLIDQKKKELGDTEVQLGDFIANLKSSISSDYLNRNITVLEGEEGYMLHLENRLRCKNKLIRDLSGRTAAIPYFKDYDSYIQDYIKKRVEAGVWLNQLVPYGEIDVRWERSSKKMLKEARELPKSFPADTVFSSWDDKTAFFSKEKGTIVGFVVKDPFITNLVNSMFDHIWNSCK